MKTLLNILIDASSSLMNDDQHMISLFENILNNPQKMQEIVQDAANNRGLRRFDVRSILNEKGSNSLTKDVMLEVCYRWLVEIDSQYYTIVDQERILVTDDMDIEARRQKDAKERYNNMYGIVKLFCSTINAREHHSFRFNDLGKREKYELALVLEDVVVRVMGENGCFPLHLVVGSAITNYLLGVVIKNNGNRKKSNDVGTKSQQVGNHLTLQSKITDTSSFNLDANEFK
jgi:hypothetical protein